MRKTAHLLAAALIVSWTAAGCTKKSENPLSPTVAGPIAGVSITAPKLLEPQNQQTLTPGTTVTLLFESATTTGERPITQELDVALDPEFAQRVHSASNLPPGQNGRTAYTLPVALQEGRAYFWRVRAVDGANTGPYSPASLFQIALSVRIETPVPLSPVRREVIAGVRPTLVAQNTAITGASNVTYRFEIAADQNFTRMIAIWSAPRSGGDRTEVTGSDLAPGTEYYWRVNASDGGYTAPYSIIQAFKTEAPPAPAPAPTPTPVPPPSGGGGGGGGGPWPRNGEEVIAWAAANYPERLAPTSSGQRRANMEFLRDRMIEAGLCGGMQLGWNMKRGGPEVSVDFLTELVGGRWHGIDIAHDYDNGGIRLQLTWADTGPDNFIFHADYPGRLPCR
ncbi:MAG TPA: hypothetical protein VNR90_14730 [Vicinamibacterales bacterium]|nr:hypothetical protein [Vicinamibacterales bacterium]